MQYEKLDFPHLTLTHEVHRSFFFKTSLSPLRSNLCQHRKYTQEVLYWYMSKHKENILFLLYLIRGKYPKWDHSKPTPHPPSLSHRLIPVLPLYGRPDMTGHRNLVWEKLHFKDGFLIGFNCFHSATTKTPSTKLHWQVVSDFYLAAKQTSCRLLGPFPMNSMPHAHIIRDLKVHNTEHLHSPLLDCLSG